MSHKVVDLVTYREGVQRTVTLPRTGYHIPVEDFIAMFDNGLVPYELTQSIL